MTSKTTSSPQVGLDVDGVLRRFCTHNVKYAAESLDGLAWFMSGKEGNYVVAPAAFRTYQHAITLDPENTPLPPAVHFGMIAKLSPANNLLGCDLNILNVPQGSREFGKGRGVFGDYESLERSAFREGWRNLVKLAMGMLPLEMDISASYGMFRLVHGNKPVLELEHDFLKKDKVEVKKSIDPAIKDRVYAIEHWPVGSVEGRRRLDELRNDYCVVPLPAHDKGGDILSPLDYRRELEGATVWVEFTMHHTLQGGTHWFAGRLRSVNVLEEAPDRNVIERDTRVWLRDRRLERSS